MKEYGNDPGLVHIYCGNGKGKTTAAVGLCVRAAGAGLRVLICQFMKDGSSAECRVLERLDGITLMKPRESVKFSFQMTERERRESRTWYNAYLKEAIRLSREGNYDVLLLDEVLYCIRAGLLEEAPVADFLRTKPERQEVILTGQDPGPQLLELADYVSEIRKIRHPYDLGIAARPGIEK